MNTNTTATLLKTIEISPSYKIPLVLVISSIPLIFVNLIASIIISVFGLFLMLQSATLRLRFTDTALDIYRGENLIRTFPYQDWINWEIFWQPIPILLYFKEVKSIHFVPILFDAKTLQECLKERCPKISKIQQELN